MSAKYGHGVEDVKDWILSKLPLGPAYYPKVHNWLMFFPVVFSIQNDSWYFCLLWSSFCTNHV